MGNAANRGVTRRYVIEPVYRDSRRRVISGAELRSSAPEVVWFYCAPEITALCTAGVAPMVPASPIPLTPKGFRCVGVAMSSKDTHMYGTC